MTLAEPIKVGAYAYVPRLPGPPDTSRHDLDAAVEAVRANRDAWVRTPPEARRRLLDEVIRATVAVADRWTEVSARHEGLDPESAAAAEEGIVGPYLFLRGVRLHRAALADIARFGRPRIAGPVRTLSNGQVAAWVMPADRWDRVTFPGTVADVWMEPGLRVDDLPATQALAYRIPPPGRVCLVLGAGNASSIAPLDIIHKLFVESQVVVCKAHPVMAHLATVHEAALAPLVRAGVLRFVYGSAAEGSYLVDHPGVDTLHITGSDRTYDAIVFGTGSEGAERKRRDQPLVTKPFTAELGNLTPIIVVPGRWSRRELDYHADNIATMLTNNAGFNCTTSRVIVTAEGWPQRTELMDLVRRRLAATATRLAYYPGARERFATFADVHPEAELIGDSDDEHLPWMLVPGLSPEAVGDPCYRVEAFCSITAETTIRATGGGGRGGGATGTGGGGAKRSATDVAGFLEQAVAFCNDALWGTLNATVIVDPRTLRDPAGGPAVERAIDALRYGTISLNHWSAIGYGSGVTPWGAFPGHHRTDIGSGTGFVHNPLMFGRVQKSVVRSPFVAWPKPVWFGSHRSAHRLVPHLVRFEADHRPDRLFPIGFHALRG